MTGFTYDELKVFFFDLDGCIYHGDVLQPGAGELLNRLRADGKQICFITNNSTQTAAGIGKKLNAMGLHAKAEEILPATDYVGPYVKQEYGIVKIKVYGSEELRTSIMQCGHRMLSIDDPEPADVVILGRDIEFTYRKLQSISLAFSSGAKIIAANPDYHHPGSAGERVPETGALAVSVEALTSEKVEYIGKPAKHFFEYGMSRYRCQSHECVMIGDNLDTDIAGGVSAGMHTVWLNAEDGQEFPGKSIKPDIRVADLQQFNQFIFADKSAASSG